MAKKPRTTISPLTLFTTLLPLVLTLQPLSTAATATATPAPAPPTNCTGPNRLTNPSFESGALDPWLPIVQSSWSPTRGVISLSPNSPSNTPNPATHSGNYAYYAHSLATTPSSLSLSQSGLDISVGKTVDCYAWVRGKRSTGVMNVEVWLDGVRCGVEVELGAGEEEWVRVGGEVEVLGGVDGTGSSVAVVVSGEGSGEEGWEVWIDDLGVVGC
ncbi:hypothetical protein E8E13_008710 [Curvularia kusanoi]|uniref:Uncharacterized protein n=1 Tax=Curvularia kusanoi TaxID=90978 RepID=A0A9P4TI38_CURKU|nr:hypothetical protein E8E13_008710 [Curvularia kusanoi]